MINPVHHAEDAAGTAVYTVEPYVMAADVYGVAPHVGRGGWTWYTGSVGWMYRLPSESLLGLQRRGDTLCIVPCSPDAWPGYRMQLRHGAAVYRIEIVRTGSQPPQLTLDGAVQPGLEITLHTAVAVHDVVLQWPRPADGDVG